MLETAEKFATYEDLFEVPDLAGWRRERMPELPQAVFFELVPDWLCEVLSPSTARRTG